MYFVIISRIQRPLRPASVFSMWWWWYSKHVTRGLWKCSGMDNSVTCKHTIPVFYLRKRSPDGATTDYSDRNLVAAYHSFIDPERIKGWINWSTADGNPHRWSPISKSSTKGKLPVTVQPLYHAGSHAAVNSQRSICTWRHVVNSQSIS